MIKTNAEYEIAYARMVELLDGNSDEEFKRLAKDVDAFVRENWRKEIRKNIMGDNVVDMGGKPVNQDNVIALDVETFSDIDPKNITSSADKEEFEHVMIIGWKKDGEMYFASSQGSAAEIVLDLEITKRMIMDGLSSGE